MAPTAAEYGLSLSLFLVIIAIILPPRLGYPEANAKLMRPDLAGGRSLELVPTPWVANFTGRHAGDDLHSEVLLLLLGLLVTRAELAREGGRTWSEEGPPDSKGHCLSRARLACISYYYM